MPSSKLLSSLISWLNETEWGCAWPDSPRPLYIAPRCAEDTRAAWPGCSLAPHLVVVILPGALGGERPLPGCPFRVTFCWPASGHKPACVETWFGVAPLRSCRWSPRGLMGGAALRSRKKLDAQPTAASGFGEDGCSGSRPRGCVPSCVFCVLLLRRLENARLKECRLLGAKGCVSGLGHWWLRLLLPGNRAATVQGQPGPRLPAGGPSVAHTCFLQGQLHSPMACLKTGPGGLLEALLLCQTAPGLESGLKA